MTFILWSFALLSLIVILGIIHRKSPRIPVADRRRDAPNYEALRIGLRLAQGVLVLLIIVSALIHSVHSIDNGHVGAIYTFGKFTGHAGDGSGGVVFTAPWTNVTQVNIQQQIDRPQATCTDGELNCLNAFSSESQDVYIVPILATKIEPENIQTLYTQVGPDYINKIVMPELIQITKEETVKYQAKDIAPQRAQIASEIQRRMTDYLSAYSVKVVNFTIQNIGFTPAFQKAIDQATTAEQNAKTEQANVAVHKATADQVIADAQGQADAGVALATGKAKENNLISASLTPGVIQYLTITKLGPDVRVIMVPESQGLILNMGDLSGSTATQPTS